MKELQRRTPAFAVTLSVGLLVSPRALAQAAGDVPAAPAVEDLVARALVRSPTVAALQARLAAARQRISPAGAPMDPMLEVMVQTIDAPWAPNRTMSMGQVSYTQPLFYPGKRGARRAAAAAEADLRGVEVGELQRRLGVEVRSVYARLYAIDREVQILRAARELADLFQATAASRYAAGVGEQEGMIKAQIAASRLAERRTDLEADRAMDVAMLNRLLDRPGDTPLGPVAGLPDSVALPEGVVERAQVNASAVAVGKAAIAAAERRLQSERLETRPNFLVGAGLGSTFMPEAAITLRFGVELPVFRGQRQAPAIEAAREDVASANADLRATRASVSAEAAGLLARFRRDGEQVILYREAIVPQTAVALDAARASYLAGRGDFSTVLEDFNGWLDARVGLARREAARYVTWSEIDALAGDPADGRQGGAP